VPTNLAAAAATCNTGSWAQQWQCKWNSGWHQPVNATATRAGFDFGHNVLPVLILVAFVFVIVVAGRRAKGAAGAARAKAPARR
jgi:hypothetical protein